MTPDGFGEWPGADEHATVGGPVRPVATDGGTDDWITLPVLVDVPREVWRRIQQHAIARRDTDDRDDATLFADALNEYVELNQIVVVDGDVKDVDDVFGDAPGE